MPNTHKGLQARLERQSGCPPVIGCVDSGSRLMRVWVMPYPVGYD
jgi:hypothetical protein